MIPSLFSPSSNNTSPDKPKTSRRWSSAMPLGPPPPSHEHRNKKPPRLSFHKTVSMTSIFESPPQQQQQPSPSPTTKARKMRNRLSSLLTTSPINLKSTTSLDKLPEDEPISEEPVSTTVESPRSFSNNTTTSSSSSSSSSFSSSADDFLATPYENFTHRHVTHTSAKQQHPILVKNNDYVKENMGLGHMVRMQLGSIMEQVDEEIEQEWEHSRRKMRQSLSLPVVVPLSSYSSPSALYHHSS